jgi:SAM-dependent methyltransferase
MAIEAPHTRRGPQRRSRRVRNPRGDRPPHDRSRHRKTDMTTRTYWDRIAPRYARRPVADPAAYDAKLARVRALLRARDRMLEIGCGTGSTALTLAPAVSEIVATDLSEGMIAIAEGKRADAEISNVRFLRAGAGDILPGAPFDVIAAFSLLHLVEDVPAVLDAVHDAVETRRPVPVEDRLPRRCQCGAAPVRPHPRPGRDRAARDGPEQVRAAPRAGPRGVRPRGKPVLRERGG